MAAALAPGAVVIGTGFGSRIHVPALRAAGFDVLALVGTDGSRTERRAERLGLRGMISVEEAVNLAGVDVVTVATTPATHAEIAMSAVRAGRHVLCEKPFCIDAREARSLVEAARSAGVVGLVGHEFRFSPERALVGRLLAEGAIGEVRLATMVSLSDLVADPQQSLPSWWFDPSQGGGWLGASGSHVVDQIRVWLGQIEWVVGSVSVVSDRRRGVADDSFALLLGLKSGAVATVHQSAGSFGPPTNITRLSGSRGSVWIDGQDVWLADGRGQRVVEMPQDLRLDISVAPSSDRRHRFTHLELGPYTRLAKALRQAVDKGRPPIDPAPATFSDGLWCMEVLDAARRSAAAGGERVALEAE